MTRVAKQSPEWSKPIEPRIASYSSDQKIKEKTLWLLPPENSPWESVTVISSPSLQIISPLGIYTTEEEKEFLYTLIYPGTRLYNLALEATELCIKFPNDPLPFYLAMLGENLQLLSSKAIRTPCINYSGSKIEALVTKRVQVNNNYIQLYLHPVYLEVDYQRPFTRLYGCSIEFLIAYSRIKYWLSKTTLEKSGIESLVNQLKASLLCLKRLEQKRHRDIYHYVNTIIRKIANLVYSTGYINPQLVDILTEEHPPVS